MTRYSSSFQPQAHMVVAHHQHARETQAAIFALMLFVQMQFGSAALEAMADALKVEVEAGHALP